MKLTEYCQEKGISMLELALITGVSRAMLYKIDGGANPTTEVINKIFFGTRERFGEGLRAEVYANLYQE